MGPMLGPWTCYWGWFLDGVSLLDIYEQNCDLISSRPSDIYYDITGSDNGWLIGSVVPRHYLDHYWPVVKRTAIFIQKIHLKILSSYRFISKWISIINIRQSPNRLIFIMVIPMIRSTSWYQNQALLMGYATRGVTEAIIYQWSLLLTWINLNPSM